MKETLFLTISALLYTIITTIFFYKKEKINKLENKIYKGLLLASTLSMINELLIVLTLNMPIIGTMVQKSFLICIVLWLSIFMLYTFSITMYDDKIKEEQNNIRYKPLFSIFVLINIILYFLIITLPINLNAEGSIIYTSGPSVNVAFATLGTYVVIMIILVIKNIKRINKKGYIPIIALIVCLIALGIVQKSHPELLLANSVFGIIVFLMYHTIENPDMKLIQELHNAKEISDAANEEKTLFLYNMTQDIRTITSKIDDDADVILDSKDYNEIYDNARDIKSNTTKFNNMTNEILDVSAIDETNLKIYNSKYNIKNIIKQLVNVYGEICNNKELKFITNIDHDIPEILYGDSINLKEVLNTILENSTKYTNNGFVEFDVNTIVKNDICRLIITIEDSGKGIKSEDINSIKISDNSLSKANQLIIAMNGTMMISSEYGKGTKVKIILDQKIEVSEEKEVTKYESSLDKIDLLVIDDSEAGLKIIEKLLKNTNITVDTSTNGKDSIDKIRVNKYDIILLDEELTSISGKDLLIKIKEIRNFNTPVLLLTKDNNYEYNEEYIKEGFTDYILKPLKKDKLLDIINKYTKKDN